MAGLPILANFGYVDRVNRTINHIQNNLQQPLKLEDVARVACFSPFHFHRIFKAIVGENPDGFVAGLRDRPGRRVAYLRVSRPFEDGRVTAAAARLVAWAREHGYASGQWLGYMWEDPEIVELDHCRYDVGVEVAADFQAQGEVGVIDFPAMTLVEIEIAGPIDLEQRAIDWLYRTWLPTSGYVPDHQPCFEEWKGLPFAHGESHFELRLQLAIVNASTAP